LPRRTEVGAREPPADDINGNSVSSKSVGCEGSDIFIARDAWPVLGEHGSGIWFDFAEGDGFESASSFKAKREPPYTAEKIKHAQLSHDVPSSSHGPADASGLRSTTNPPHLTLVITP
jgi:hypothetical protein